MRLRDPDWGEVLTLTASYNAKKMGWWLLTSNRHSRKESSLMMIVSCTWRMFAILKNLNCLFLVWCVSRKASLDLATRQECGISASTNPYWHKAGNAAAWTLLAGFHGLKAAPSWKGSLYPPSTTSCLEERSSRSRRCLNWARNLAIWLCFLRHFHLLWKEDRAAGWWNSSDLHEGVPWEFEDSCNPPSPQIATWFSADWAWTSSVMSPAYGLLHNCASTWLHAVRTSRPCRRANLLVKQFKQHPNFAITFQLCAWRMRASW